MQWGGRLKAIGSMSPLQAISVGAELRLNSKVTLIHLFKGLEILFLSCKNPVTPKAPFSFKAVAMAAWAGLTQVETAKCKAIHKLQ